MPCALVQYKTNNNKASIYFRIKLIDNANRHLENIKNQK